MTASTEETTETETEEVEEPAEQETAKPEKDWEAEFKAQQRINRDLERKMKQRTTTLEKQLADAAKKPPAEDKPEVDLDAIRQQIQSETRAEALKDKVLDKIEAKAARMFKDPEDALLRLGKNPDEYIVDGKIDIEAINDALDELLQKRPDFGVTQGDSKRFKGTADSGPKGIAGKPQMTKAEMQALYKAGKHEEIEAARKAGQLDTLLGIKS